MRMQVRVSRRGRVRENGSRGRGRDSGSGTDRYRGGGSRVADLSACPEENRGAERGCFPSLQGKNGWAGPQGVLDHKPINASSGPAHHHV